MKIKEAFNIGEGHGRLWFMSDLHYNHANVIKFNKRPFETVEEMNEYIEEELAVKVQHNGLVGKGLAAVGHLGGTSHVLRPHILKPLTAP